MAIFDPKKVKNKVIPAGEYLLEIYDTKRWNTQGNINTGKSSKPCLSFKYKVLNGEHEGKKSSENFFYEGADWMLANFMENIGVGDGSFNTDNEEQTKNLFVGKRFMAILNIKEYNGKDYNNLDLNSVKELTDNQIDMVSGIEPSIPVFEEDSGSSNPSNNDVADSDDIPF